MPPQILLLGHRGDRHRLLGYGSLKHRVLKSRSPQTDLVENTLAAFDLALERGANGFEFDVRCTRDGKTIICHDPRLHRLVVRRSTLRQLRTWHKSPGQISPTLEEVLERYGHVAFLNIEVKVRGMEELVVRAVRRARPSQYFISSFLPSVIRKLHALDPSLNLGALAQTSWQLRRWRTLPVTYVVPQYRLLSRRLVNKLHQSGKRVVTWTVNKPKHMLRAAELGVDGIISDDTRLLVETLRPDRRPGA